MKITLHDAAGAIGAAMPAMDADVLAVSTDSRSAGAGELFVAIAGERFDGHDFLADVAARGACAAVVAAGHPALANAPLPLLVVNDTRRAYGALAGWWRRHFAIPVIGIVGSNGKTTVKEMCAAILRSEFGKDAVLATTGNLNNDIGLPAMTLRLTPTHRVAVLEIGMNHPGETRALAAIAAPTVALVNNAQREHQEFMKSVEAVAEEHALLLDALDAQGIAVFNADDAFAPLWRARAGARTVLDFGLVAGDVRGRFDAASGGGRLHVASPWGEIDVDLAVPGEHNARNTCAAAAACLAAGASLDAVRAGLSAFGGVKGRLQRRRGRDGVRLIDDTYNANPDSMRAAIDVLAAIPGHRVFVMGDMGEVGENGAQMHDEVGGYARSRGIDRLLCLGEQSRAAAANFGDGGEHFTQVDGLLKALRGDLRDGTTVLVKGSRFMRMERIADALATEEGNDRAA